MLILVLLATASFWTTFAKAENGIDSPNVGQENSATETKDAKMKQEELRKILQQKDNAKGESDLAKLLASHSITVAKLELEKEELAVTVAKLELEKEEEFEETKKELRETKNQMRKLEKEMKKRDEVMKNLHSQIKIKDKRLRQLDQKISVASLGNVFEESKMKIKNKSKRIERLDNGLCGTCALLNNTAKLDPIKPYRGSCYAVYTERLIWATARSACANYGGQLASMETNEEWRHVFSQLQSKNKQYAVWLGAQKVGGGGPHEGWRWLTGVDISKDNAAWNSPARGKGKCLLVLNVNEPGTPVTNSWLDDPCNDSQSGYAYPSLCEFKN